MGIDPDSLFEWIGDPVSGPMPFIMLTDGWIEASEAMARVHETIHQQANLEALVEFDVDRLLDQRARRPVVELIDGVMQDLQWPELVISLGTDSKDRPFLYMHGPEPDFNWRPFATATATVLQSIGVSCLYTIGAYPVPAPHTRPVRISHAASCPDLLVGRNKTGGHLSIPVGVQMAVTQELRTSGVQTLGFYAQVPYYISTSAWPQASIGLLDGLCEAAGLCFDTAALESQVPEAAAAVDAMLADAPSLADLVAELEQRFDDLSRIEEADLPTGDELEEELQQFLRDIEE
ncbi:MAG: PAC2 family protein [Actinomycetota bacterium]